MEIQIVIVKHAGSPTDEQKERVRKEFEAGFGDGYRVIVTGEDILGVTLQPTSQRVQVIESNVTEVTGLASRNRGAEFLKSF